MLDPGDRRILSYVTSDYGHERIREISQIEGVKLVREAGLFDGCGYGIGGTGDGIINKFAAQVDPEKDLWVYNHDGDYFITSPRRSQ